MKKYLVRFIGGGFTEIQGVNILDAISKLSHPVETIKSIELWA